MALLFTNLAAVQSTTDTNSYATGSISPTGNRLILVSITSYPVSGAGAAPSGVSGNGITYEKITERIYSGINMTTSIWRGMAASPSAGAVTASFAANQSECEIVVDQSNEEVDTSGTNGSGAIVQSASNDASGTSGVTVTLAAFGSANNAAYAAYGSGAATINAGSGFTSLGTTVGGDIFSLTQYKLNDTTAEVTGGTFWTGGIAVEVKAAAGGGASQWGAQMSHTWNRIVQR